MNLEVNGTVYEAFTDIAVNIRMDALCREFSFGASRAGGAALPFKGGEPCRVRDDADIIATGFIERVDIAYSATSHTIQIGGRDKPADLLDSTLRSISDFRPPISLKRCIELALKDIGAADIKVIDLANPEPFKTVVDLIAPEPGEGCFEFIEKLARKRKVLVTSDPDGNIVIARAGEDRSAGAIQNLAGAPDNNVLSSSASYDMTARFYRYTFTSSLNLVALANAGIVVPSHIVNQRGYAIDNSIRRSRQLALQPESALAAKDNTARAEWEANVRQSRGKLYSCVLPGFRESPGGALWGVNRLVRVRDEFVDIEGDMRISAVAFSLDESAGSTTTITCMPPNAFTLSLSQPVTDKTGTEFLIEGEG
jgi:prophage tail gpP-like protein